MKRADQVKWEYTVGAACRAAVAVLFMTVFVLFALGSPVEAVQPVGSHAPPPAADFDAGGGFEDFADMSSAACSAHSGCVATIFTAPSANSVEPVASAPVDYPMSSSMLTGRTSIPATKPPIA